MPSPKMPHSSHTPVQKSAVVAERLEKAILSGRFSVGERLPSEAELGEKFAASRTVIREALKRLSARGIVQTVNGSGSYVSGVTVGDLKGALQRYAALLMPGEGIAELFDLRIILESGAAAMLAERPDPLHMAPVTHYLEEMRQSLGDVPRFASLDMSFHMAIVASTGNQLMQAIHASLEPMMRRLANEMYGVVTGISHWMDEHEHIHAAILKGDPSAASEAIRSHLMASKKLWLQSTAPSQRSFRIELS